MQWLPHSDKFVNKANRASDQNMVSLHVHLLYANRRIKLH